MNTRTKEVTVADVEQQIAENRDKYRKDAEKIEADKYLSDEGRAIKLAEIKKAADDTHRDVLTPTLQQAVKKEYDNRYGMAFGPGRATKAEYRAVDSQAAAAPDAKALERLKAQAINTGDDVLLNVVWHNAYDRGYDGLLNDGDETIQGLLEFAYANGRQTNDPAIQRRVRQRRFEQSIKRTAPHR